MITLLVVVAAALGLGYLATRRRGHSREPGGRAAGGTTHDPVPFDSSGAAGLWEYGGGTTRHDQGLDVDPAAGADWGADSSDAGGSDGGGGDGGSSD